MALRQSCSAVGRPDHRMTLNFGIPQLSARSKAQNALKSADSIKRFTYLLGQTDLFKHFCDLKVRFEHIR